LGYPTRTGHFFFARLRHALGEYPNCGVAEVSRTIAKGAHAVLVLDGDAGWHGAKSPKVPDNITTARSITAREHAKTIKV
jgi:hypothetical protein